MHPLAVLRYCQDVLAERQQRDAWNRWFWQLRVKVLRFWIARLEREAGAANIPALTPAEQLVVRQTHPLLAPRAPVAETPPTLERDWPRTLRNRVEQYLAARQAHQ